MFLVLQHFEEFLTQNRFESFHAKRNVGERQPPVFVGFARFAVVHAIRNRGSMVTINGFTFIAAFRDPIPGFLSRNGNDEPIRSTQGRIEFMSTFQNAENDVLNQFLEFVIVVAIIFQGGLPGDFEQTFL